MKLTGKSKTDFEEWYLKTHCNNNGKEITQWQRLEVFDWLYSSSETIQNAFIIERFDSVGVFIEINLFLKKTELGTECTFKSFVNNEIVQIKHHFGCYDSRQEATEDAIKKANEIYNDLFVV